MKKIIVSCFVVLVLFSIPFTLFAAKEVKVEVLYMNHGPLLSSLSRSSKFSQSTGTKLMFPGTTLRAKKENSSWPRRG